MDSKPWWEGEGGVPIRLHIHARRTEQFGERLLEAQRAAFRQAAGEDPCDDASEDEVSDRTPGEEEITDLYSAGWMEHEGGSVTIHYKEPGDGMEDISTTIAFAEQEPGLVHLIRDGDLEMNMTFRARDRVVCAYRPMQLPPEMTLQLTVHCLMVENRWLTEGILRFEYILEMRGIQMSWHQIELTLLDAEKTAEAREEDVPM